MPGETRRVITLLHCTGRWRKRSSRLDNGCRGIFGYPKKDFRSQKFVSYKEKYAWLRRQPQTFFNEALTIFSYNGIYVLTCTVFTFEIIKCLLTFFSSVPFSFDHTYMNNL